MMLPSYKYMISLCNIHLIILRVKMPNLFSRFTKTNKILKLFEKRLCKKNIYIYLNNPVKFRNYVHDFFIVKHNNSLIRILIIIMCYNIYILSTYL